MALLERGKLEDVVSSFKSKSVLVVGDLMVDRYVSINARKLSREAPVPVGDLHDEKLNLGGAGNLANNIANLGGKVKIAGFVGKDSQGEWIKSALDRIGVESKGIDTSDRPTTLKTRYIVNGFQHLRVDREIRSDITPELSDSVMESAQNFMPDCDIVAIADYDKGTITSYLVDMIVGSARKAGKVVIAQPKVRHYMDLRGVNYIKSNEREASIATGISVLNESGLKNIATNLSTRLGYKGLILTRGERGITVFEQNNMSTIPPLIPPNEFSRAVGLRDAMTSVMTLALASGANSSEAAALGNIAAAKRADRVGTVVVSSEDLIRTLALSSRILDSVVQVPLRR